jgi:hypothetical protein
MQALVLPDLRSMVSKARDREGSRRQSDRLPDADMEQ